MQTGLRSGSVQSARCVVRETKRASLLALVHVRHLACCVAVQSDVYTVGFPFVTPMRCRCLTWALALGASRVTGTFWGRFAYLGLVCHALAAGSHDPAARLHCC